MKIHKISAALLVILIITSNALPAQSLYKQRKYFGPIPFNNLNIGVGFIDGPTSEYLMEHMDIWTGLHGGQFVYDDMSTAFFATAGYERMITPFHFLKINASFGYLKAEGTSDYFTSDPIVHLLAEHEFKVFYYSLDLGIAYYLTEPKVRTIVPYIAGGFSTVFPLARLGTDALQENGEPFDTPEENLEQNDLHAGLHLEFGMRYFLSNVYAAGLEGRYQMSQSKFKIHGGNFDIDYSGLSLALNFYYFF